MLGMIAEAMGRAEQDEEENQPDLAAYPQGAAAVPPARPAMEPADVPVDNSAGPAAGDAVPAQQRQRRGERTAKSTRHGSLG
jgi:hypothetical protein